MYKIKNIYSFLAVYLHEIYHWLAAFILFWRISKIHFEYRNREDYIAYCTLSPTTISNRWAAFNLFGIRFTLFCFAPLIFTIIITCILLISTNIFVLIFFLIIQLFNLEAFVLSESDVTNGIQGWKLFLKGKPYFSTFQNKVNYGTS